MIAGTSMSVAEIEQGEGWPSIRMQAVSEDGCSNSKWMSTDGC